ncbi:phage protease [Rubellicoccus peritrichatus]|uniref:Phage protease n=1 Tax=Rubellicoccus peritrichatus TaxID=3080537 RepID=A0AAQ3QRB9_9BACT|nr:phage protease [Puniceicoccus sp. CR14]WOO41168.1 phage protease [Puniceicoccus sp. CR14]
MNTKSENIEFGVSNAIDQNKTSDGPWLRMAEYGDWPHARGMQRFSRRSAERLTDYFKSLRGRMARRFGGLPIYIGHPDDPGFAGQSGHDDTRAYAWIVDMDARFDGLYILPRWSEEGRRLLENAFYKFLSPRWAMRSIGENLFEPTRLISVGLTNMPNIPGDAIANESERSETEAIVDADSASDDELVMQNERFQKIVAGHEAARARAESAFVHERRERITLLLEKAQREGRIAASDSETWEQELQDNFEIKLEELCNAEPVLGAEFISSGLGQRKGAISRRTDFIAMVNERAEGDGSSYADAWTQLKRERPDLYEELNVNR